MLNIGLYAFHKSFREIKILVLTSVVHFLLFKRTSCLSFDFFIYLKKPSFQTWFFTFQHSQFFLKNSLGMSNFKLDLVLTTYTYPKTHKISISTLQLAKNDHLYQLHALTKKTKQNQTHIFQTCSISKVPNNYMYNTSPSLHPQINYSKKMYTLTFFLKLNMCNPSWILFTTLNPKPKPHNIGFATKAWF